MNGSSRRLTDLRHQTQRRTLTLEQVCAALPPKLAETIVSAGIDGARLTIGVAGAAWAARLRYVTETVRIKVNESMGTHISSVRIRVVPPAG